MKKTAFVALLASSFSMSAHAVGNIYLTAQGGIGGMDTKQYSANSDPYNGYSLRSGSAYRLAMGYLLPVQNGLNLGLEAGYVNYPNNSYDVYNGIKEVYSGHYVDLLGVGKLYLNGGDMGLYGLLKAGVAFVSQKFDGTGQDITGAPVTYYSDTKNGIAKPEFALGVGYDFNKNVGVDVTYYRVVAGQADPNSSDVSDLNEITTVNTLMVGLTVKLPQI